MITARLRYVLLAATLLAALGGYALAQVPATPPAAAAAAASAVEARRQESNTSLWMILRSGGWAMWPLGACSIATVSLVILNFYRVRPKSLVPPALVADLRSAARGGDVGQMWTVATAADCLFGRAIAAGLRHVQLDDPAASRVKMEEAIAETASREESQYGFFVNFLALLTSMSPMWGLLGTVSGMIGAFSKIGSGGMGKPEMLAKNIGEALVCTASGLMIAITAMGFYFYFRNTLNATMKQSEKHFTEILEDLTGVHSVFDEPHPGSAPAAKAASEKA